HYIPCADQDRPEIQLRPADQGNIALPERVFRIVDEMPVLVEQDTELRTRQQTQHRNRPVTEQHRHREPVQLPLYIVDTIRHHRGEIAACPIIRLIEIQLGLYAPAFCNIKLSEGSCHIS